MRKFFTHFIFTWSVVCFFVSASLAQNIIPHVDLTVRYNTTSQMYEVYAQSDSTLNSFYMGGGSQVSIVLPAIVADAGLTIVSNAAAGPWSDNSQLYAPPAQPANDFHSITSNGTMPAITYTAGGEVLLFSFTIPGGGCEPGIRIFRNNSEGSFAADPNSATPGMFGGDFLNYIGEVNSGDNYYKANYDNEGSDCIGNPPVIAVVPPIFMPEDSSIIVCTTFQDPDTGDSFTASTACAPSNGSIGTPTISNDTICMAYTPTANWNGTDTICMVVCDQKGLCDTIDVIINVLPVNDPPVIVTVTPNPIPEDSTRVICTPFSDPDAGDTFTATLCNTPIGTAIPSIIGNEVCFSYTSSLNYNGLDTVCIVVCDNSGACDTLEVPLVITPVNDAPIAIDGTATTPEETTELLVPNTSDVDGPSVVITVPNQPTNGTASVNPNGTITYTPTLNFVGLDTVVYVVCDAGTPNLCDTAQIIVTVTPVNDPPVIVDLIPTVLPEDTMITVCTTFSDPDNGDTFSAAICEGANNGTATVVMTGNQLCITYTPQADFYGLDSICISVCDNSNACDSSIVVFNVTNVNDAPILGDTSLITNNGTPVSACVSVDDVDLMDMLTASSCAGSPANGSISFDPITNGSLCFTYTPNSDFAGLDTLCIIVCDNGTPSLCDTTWVPVEVVAEVFAINDINTTLFETTTFGNVLSNDHAELAITATQLSGPSNGTIALNPDGSYAYTPNAGFTGQDVIVYSACTIQGICDTATLVIQVFQPTAGNDMPIANDDVAETFVNTQVAGNVISNDFDPDNNPLVNATVASSPSNGSVVLNSNGSFLYTPNTGFVGIDSFTYKVYDDVNPALCDVATVTIYVTEDENGVLVNDPPVANTDVEYTITNVAISANLNANDSDPNNNALVYTAMPVDAPNNGTVTISANGSYIYTPNAGFYGTDQFVYRVCDAPAPGQMVLCDTAMAIIIVAPPTPNAINDINTVLAGEMVDGNVLTNDEPNGLAVTASVVTGASNGVFVLNTDGTYDYTPNAGFVGEETIVYSICNAAAICDTAVLTIQVYEPTSENDAPIANDDVAQTNKNVPVDGNVLNNDFDPENGILTVNTTPVQGPSFGSVTLNSDGTFTYEPNPNFVGIDSFIYRVCDIAGLCSEATVVIEVGEDFNGTGVNDAPIANDDLRATPMNTAISSTAKPNDSDPNGNSLTFAKVSNPSNGTVTMLSNGNFTYTPATGFYGTDQFVYRICDIVTPSSSILCDTATVYIVVQPSVPDAVTDINNTFVNTPIIGNILTNDEEGLIPATASIISSASNGIFALAANGSYVYTPNNNFVGEDQVMYMLCNTAGVCDTAFVLLKVIGPDPMLNDAPIANDDVAQTMPSTPVSGDVLVNDIDPELDPLVATLLNSPTHGTVSLNPNGAFTYTPATGFNGMDNFTYIACDGGSPALCDTATVYIEVNPDPTPGINDEPYAEDDAIATVVNTAVDGTLAANDSDPNGNDLIYTTTPVVAPSNGSVSINTDGTYTYTPNPGYVGTDQFQYQVCDVTIPSAASKCDTATVYVSVFEQTSFALNLKVMLQGALLNTSNGEMRDDLRLGQHIPLAQPYNSTLSTRFTPIGYNAGSETTTTATLSANAGTSDAIVDWVFVEFRSNATAASTLLTLSALVQRDGDIVATDGGQLVVALPAGAYYVAVKHRNHLGAMTANSLAFTLGQTTDFDFTTATSAELWNDATHDGVEQVSITHNSGTVQALWAGNTNADIKTKYDGFGTDMQALSSDILEAQGGSGPLNYNNAIGYYQGDVNMDGKAKYDGFRNDRILIQQIVRSYPNNGGVLNNYNLMIEQIQN